MVSRRQGPHLTYGTDSVLAPQLMLYQERSRSDEVYLKLISRPAKRWTIQADAVLYLVRPDRSGDGAGRSRATQNAGLLQQARVERAACQCLLQLQGKENGLLGYSNYDQYTGFSAPQAQKVSSTLQSAGLNLSLVPRETVKVNLGYAWTQMDFDAYYFSTNRVRFHYLNVTGGGTTPRLWLHDLAPGFSAAKPTNFRVDSHTLSAGLNGRGAQFPVRHLFPELVEGHNASGLSEPLPDVDNSVDNQLHTLSLGLDYPWKDYPVAQAEL